MYCTDTHAHPFSRLPKFADGLHNPYKPPEIAEAFVYNLDAFYDAQITV